ncbi:hypothetical protein VSA01S_37920 [Vibrio sagamiensis NBRC 104589]|uniref:Uncharacterized protein n=1 Tax=Vibrio sagamiensis NBRC 104589 TaxID=1219064 RepID=A0A511QK22_9VIBR|nr:hypothetical protein VSA01S_37920 [Vibrio sagamiensis NBRC 104589]
MPSLDNLIALIKVAKKRDQKRRRWGGGVHFPWCTRTFGGFTGSY